MILLFFTLLEILVVIAILIILGGLIAGIWFATKKVKSSGGTSGGAVIMHKLEFLIPRSKENEPDIEFPKNTQATFKVQLSKYNAGSMGYKGFDGQDSFVGIVEPNTISVLSINGNPPGTAKPVNSLPVTAYKTSSTSNGTITIILQGSEPADGMLSVFYLSSSEGLLTAQADFSITDE